MKKLMLGVGFLCVFSVSYAEMIEKILIEQKTGATAQYTYANGELNWTDGGFTYIYTENGGFFSFDSAELDATFDLYNDDSADGTAKARFDLVGDWTFSLFSDDYGADPVVIISGDLNSGGGFGTKYWEEETGYEALDGKAWVNVNSVWADSTWLQTEVYDVHGWDGLSWDTDGIAGLDSDVTLDPGTGDISDYGQDYSSNNGLTLTLWADQGQVVPEPATLALLGLGGLLLRRKK